MEKTLVLGKIEGRRTSRQQRMRCKCGIIYSMEVSLSKFQETVKDRESWPTAVHEVTESDTIQQMNKNNSGKQYGNFSK